MKRKSSRLVRRSLALSLATLLLHGPLMALEIDGIAARVGSEVILKSDVVIEMRRARLDKEHYAEVLQEMIERKLIVKAAAAAKMTMQEWVIESRVREIIQKNFGSDRNKLMEVLSRDKVSYTEWYAKLKEDMVVSAMRYQVVDKNVTASPAQLTKEYRDHPERYEEIAKVSFSSILLKPEDEHRRGEILSALKTDPTRFAELARMYSADAQAKNGGLWKEVNPSDAFRKEICDVISVLKVGQMSDWIAIDGWFYLIRKDAETAGKKLTFEQAYDKIAENVKENEAKRLYSAWIERLKEENYVKVF